PAALASLTAVALGLFAFAEILSLREAMVAGTSAIGLRAILRGFAVALAGGFALATILSSDKNRPTSLLVVALGVLAVAPAVFCLALDPHARWARTSNFAFGAATGILATVVLVLVYRLVNGTAGAHVDRPAVQPT